MWRCRCRHVGQREKEGGANGESSPVGLVTKSCPTLATPWTVACQSPPSMGFSRQDYWMGLPFPSQSSIEIYALPYVKYLASGQLLYSAGSSARCSVMT